MKLLFLLDYDGTLTDFKKNPDHSRLTSQGRRVLNHLHQKHMVILVTGRFVKSLQQVSRLKGFSIAGSHGFEGEKLPGGLQLSSPHERKRHKKEALRLWKNLQALYAPFPRIHIEKKPYSSTLHYRGLNLGRNRLRDLRNRFLRIFRKSVTLRFWGLQEGKMMLEAKPKSFSKGGAVSKILKNMPGYFPIYAGDDFSDLSAFKAVGQKGLRVAIGKRLPKSASDLRFESPAQFIEWLGKF